MTKLNDLKAGDRVKVDGGFTCMKAGETTVKDDGGHLYVMCSQGRHYLSGQINDDDGTLSGVFKCD